MKASLKKCAASALILWKLNQDLLTLRKDSITQELNIPYKYFSSPQDEHSKPLFRDNFSRSIKEITETNKWISVCLRKLFTVASVVLILPRTQTLLVVIVEIRHCSLGAWVKEKNSSWKASRAIGKAVIHTIAKTTAVIVTRPFLYKTPKWISRFQ